MRIAAIKINLLLIIALSANVGMSYSAPSRIECLERLGNTTTKAELDNCVNPTTLVPQKSAQVGTINLTSEEATCLELGFKKKTPPYLNCILELQERKENATATTDPDDATCRNYGFKRKTNEYATCRQQIEQARAQAAQQQAQYLQQQKQYQAQLDEQQRQRSVAAGMALFQLGNGITSGAYNANNSYGTRPTPPTAPNPSSTYFLPGGRTMNCTTTGTVTNCF